MSPFWGKTFSGLSLFTWNLEPYIHNLMRITEPYDKAEFAQMEIKKECREPVRDEGEPNTKRVCMKRSWLESHS